MKVFTRKVPFEGAKGPAAVMYIMTGTRPERPNHPNFTESLWTLTRRCWCKEPQDRPKMWEVIEVLKDPSTPTPPHKGEREKRFKVRRDQFQQDVVLIPQQREGKQKELEGEAVEGGAGHQKKETEVGELKEKLEACHDPCSLRKAIALTTLQKDKRRKELGPEKEGNQKESRELKETPEVRFDPPHIGTLFRFCRRGNSITRRRPGRLNTRRKVSGLGNSGRSLWYATIFTPSKRPHSDPITGGNEGKGSRARGGVQRTRGRA